MSYSRKHNVIFVHIPKNAGTSVVNTLKLEHGHRGLGHLMRLKEQHPHTKSFAIVRNPYDRLVSTYEYYMMDKSYWHSKDKSRPFGMTDAHMKVQKKNATFKQFVDMILQGEITFENNIHLRPQHVWICDDKHKCMVDCVLRMETDSLCNDLRTELNITLNALKQDNKSTRQFKTFEQYYDDELFKSVYNLYKTDFELFKYDEIRKKPNNNHSMSQLHKYRDMQKHQYEHEYGMDPKRNGGHNLHNNNPDYWNILLGDVFVDKVPTKKFQDKHGLDFGCGCGRNIINLHNEFKQVDGVDISSLMTKITKENLSARNIKNSEVFTCNGLDLNDLKSDTYDFIMSTIVLQHICVHAIRYKYLQEFYRVMTDNGILSIQMGCNGILGARVHDYFADYVNAQGTNSRNDVTIRDPENEIVKDLKKVGFRDVSYTIQKTFSDGNHKNWIYLRAIK
jgi:ubiquinone/menaquinone biosynthesis C-methylase UbiE